MTASSSLLTPLQRDLLDAFFSRTPRFFLTGGAALAGFYLHHRATKDLDLFTTPDVDLEEGVRALLASAAALEASVERVQSEPDFRRFRVVRSDDATVVDLVLDRVAPLDVNKPAFGQIRVDSVREIAANKVCALLSRAEVRDLVDLKWLLDSGQKLEEVLADAGLKDAGANPATLAWVLSNVRIGPLAPLPAGENAQELETFRADLVARLRRMALPPE